MSEKYKPYREEFEALKQKQQQEEAEFISQAHEEALKDNQDNQEIQEYGDIIAHEKGKIKEFFGYDIEVPPLPSEITPELYEKWKELGFELHYLPNEDLTQDRDLPGWEKKPRSLFYDLIQEGRLSKSATELPGAWILTDSRDKPDGDDGYQVYQNDDEIGQALQELRSRGIIKNYGKNENSRFNISLDELNKEETKEALSSILNVLKDSLRLPRAIEWNYLGNAFHKEWGKTNTWEWFEDAYDKDRGRRLNGDRRLGGGSFDKSWFSYMDGLSDVGGFESGYRNNYLGFRPLVAFSSKSK